MYEGCCRAIDFDVLTIFLTLWDLWKYYCDLLVISLRKVLVVMLRDINCGPSRNHFLLRMIVSSYYFLLNSSVVLFLVYCTGYVSEHPLTKKPCHYFDEIRQYTYGVHGVGCTHTTLLHLACRFWSWSRCVWRELALKMYIHSEYSCHLSSVAKKNFGDDKYIILLSYHVISNTEIQLSTRSQHKVIPRIT